MRQTYDIAVVGGGINGLAVASLLANCASNKQFNVTLIDAGPRVQFSANGDIALRVSALAMGSAELLDSVG